MSRPLYQVDAFAERPFSGNPAAVCLLDAEAEAEWMQSVAMEMQLSETAFVHPSGEGFDLRWFTPAEEVELCGRGVGLTAPASRDGFDYVARFFAPRLRIDEDPVTGSLQCALGPWWQRRTGRDRLDAYQASARGGALRVFCRGDRVTLSGRAVTVLRAELLA